MEAIETTFRNRRQTSAATPLFARIRAGAGGDALAIVLADLLEEQRSHEDALRTVASALVAAGAPEAMLAEFIDCAINLGSLNTSRHVLSSLTNMPRGHEH